MLLALLSSILIDFLSFAPFSLKTVRGGFMTKRLVNFQCPARTRDKLKFIRAQTGHSLTTIIIIAIDAAYDNHVLKARHESEMRMKAVYLDEKQLLEVNAALSAAGYAAYPGDRTTRQPQGCGAGYAMNLVDSTAGADPDARREVKAIVSRIVSA